MVSGNPEGHESCTRLNCDPEFVCLRVCVFVCIRVWVCLDVCLCLSMCVCIYLCVCVGNSV